MTANQAIEIINNAQKYSEEEYKEAVRQINEWKQHSEGLEDIQEIDAVVYKQSDKFEELQDELRGYHKKMDRRDTFDAKTCQFILKILFEEDVE